MVVISLIDLRCEPRRGLAPEIAHFRIPSDKSQSMLDGAPGDWYIKGARYVPPIPALRCDTLVAYRPGIARSVGEFPPYDARYMLRCASSSHAPANMAD